MGPKIVALSDPPERTAETLSLERFPRNADGLKGDETQGSCGTLCQNAVGTQPREAQNAERRPEPKRFRNA